MQDVLYIVATIAFFAAMVAFVAGCARIVGPVATDAVPGGIVDEPTTPMAPAEEVGA